MTDINGQGDIVPDAQPVAPAAPEPVAPAQAAAPVQPAMPELPVSVPDRTKDQFDKLLESNRRLFETNAMLNQELEQTRTIRQQPSVPSQPAQSVNPDDFVEMDPVTGDRVINEKRLKSKLDELQEKALRAEQAIQSYTKQAEEREIDRQERETFAVHPELNYRDPSNFDAEFNRLVRATLTDSFYAKDEYGGRPLTFKAAADLVRTKFPKPVAAVVAPVVDTTAASNAAQQAKEQSSAQPTSQNRNQATQSSSDEDKLAELRYRTRYQNDDKALAERIMHTEHILPKDVPTS